MRGCQIQNTKGVEMLVLRRKVGESIVLAGVIHLYKVIERR